MVLVGCKTNSKTENVKIEKKQTTQVMPNLIKPVNQQTVNNSQDNYVSQIIINKCSSESRNVDYCIEVYQPVCGWFTEDILNCKKTYCRESFANSCFACKDKRIIGYTEGKCK